jgi:hypothetical protein
MSRRVSCIPSTDTGFRDAAKAALATIPPTIGPDQVESMLCELLIDRYPRVDVHRQDELGRVFDTEVWYAYRDGRPDHGSPVDSD